MGVSSQGICPPTKPVRFNGIAGTFNNYRGCGGAAPHGGGFRLTKDTIDRNSQAEIEIAASHEMGHLYGVPNTSGGIMRGLVPNGNHRQSGLHPEDCYDMLKDNPGHGRPSTSIQAADVQNAVECINQAWQGRQFKTTETRPFKKQVPPEKGGGECTEMWTTEVTYSCSKVNGTSIGCAVTGVYQLSLVSSNCPS